MPTHFPTITEKRYAAYPRRYSNGYFWDSRRSVTDPDSKGACATLASAKTQALRAIGVYAATTVRIFDRRTGQYVFTLKASAGGITIAEGCVK